MKFQKTFSILSYRSNVIKTMRKQRLYRVGRERVKGQLAIKRRRSRAFFFFEIYFKSLFDSNFSDGTTENSRKLRTVFKTLDRNDSGTRMAQTMLGISKRVANQYDIRCSSVYETITMDSTLARRPNGISAVARFFYFYGNLVIFVRVLVSCVLAGNANEAVFLFFKNTTVRITF